MISNYTRTISKIFFFPGCNTKKWILKKIYCSIIFWCWIFNELVYKTLDPGICHCEFITIENREVNLKYEIKYREEKKKKKINVNVSMSSFVLFSFYTYIVHWILEEIRNNELQCHRKSLGYFFSRCTFTHLKVGNALFLVNYSTSKSLQD